MSDNSTLTNAEISSMIKSTQPAPTTDVVETALHSGVITPHTTRKLIVIGAGDGGCNIVSEISKRIPDEVYTIAYNSSDRNMGNIKADSRIVPSSYVEDDGDNYSGRFGSGPDGAGKSRKESKRVFRDYHMNEAIYENVVAHIDGVDYVIIISTADGGTGSGCSPQMAAMLSSNINVPVLVIGVYPYGDEDITSQSNAMHWQYEIEHADVPYIIVDNNIEGLQKLERHKRVNDYIVGIISLLAGKEFGNSQISIIDNQNLYMLMHETAGRIVVAMSKNRPSSNQTLDDYIFDLLERDYQPEPDNCHAIGIFVKGSKDLISRMDTSLNEVQKKYGRALLLFPHIEESDETEIAIIMSGCNEPESRLMMMKKKYGEGYVDRREPTKSFLDDYIRDIKNPSAVRSAQRAKERALNLNTPMISSSSRTSIPSKPDMSLADELGFDEE